MKKPITQQHRDNLAQALKGNKNGLGKNLGNKNAFGKNRGESNGNWNGATYTLSYKEKIAGRARASLCEICYKITKTDFDHSHETGEFRGWICRRCNLVLGMVRDSQPLLRLLADYLDYKDEKTRPKIILNLHALQRNNGDAENTESK